MIRLPRRLPALPAMLLAALVSGAALPAPSVAATSYPFVTNSWYEKDSTTAKLYDQGCTQAKAWPVTVPATSGLVILDFGRLEYEAATKRYGASGFGSTFVWNGTINTWMQAYANGFHTCRPPLAVGTLTLARGTSNYLPSGVPDHFMAGYWWATWTERLATWLQGQGMTEIVAAGADDIEPQWDPGYRASRDFVDGYASVTARTMWNYGGLAPGWWTSAQQWGVWGRSPAGAAPEVYYASMAQQVETLSLWGATHNRGPLNVQAVMSQYPNGGYSPQAAYDAMLAQLQSDSRTFQDRIPYLTVIGGLTAAQRQALHLAEGI